MNFDKAYDRLTSHFVHQDYPAILSMLTVRPMTAHELAERLGVISIETVRQKIDLLRRIKVVCVCAYRSNEFVYTLGSEDAPRNLTRRRWKAEHRENCLYCGQKLHSSRRKFCSRHCNNRHNIIKGKNK